MEANVTTSEKNFIEYLVGFIVDSSPGDLFTNHDKISKHLQDNFDPKHDLNLYRKSFGSIKNVTDSPATAKVVELNGLRMNFVPHEKMIENHAKGILTEAAWQKYQDGYKQHMIKHLTLAKNNK